MEFYPASEHILYFLKRGSFKQKKNVFIDSTDLSDHIQRAIKYIYLFMI